MAVIIAVGVNSDGVREVLGMAVGASEPEPFWTSFLRSLTRRGLRGVKLVIADSLWSTEHESNRTRTHDSYTTPRDAILYLCWPLALLAGWKGTYDMHDALVRCQVLRWSPH